jgi:hypothetical protein
VYKNGYTEHDDLCLSRLKDQEAPRSASKNVEAVKVLFLAAETIAAYVDAEEWQVTEIHQDLKHLDDGRLVPHDRVVT